MNETLKLIKISLIIGFIIIIVSNFELMMNEYNASFSSNLPKTYIGIPPEKTGLKKTIWVYDTKYTHVKDIEFNNDYNNQNYVKERIYEHIGSKLNRPIKELFKMLGHLPKTTMPINNLYKTISKGEEAVMNADPGSAMSDARYKILYSRDDYVEAFISGDMFYIINKKQTDV